MHHGTVFGDVLFVCVPQNSPVIHCQPRYYQASCAIPKCLIGDIYQETFDGAGSAVLTTCQKRHMPQVPRFLIAQFFVLHFLYRKRWAPESAGPPKARGPKRRKLQKREAPKSAGLQKITVKLRVPAQP